MGEGLKRPTGKELARADAVAALVRAGCAAAVQSEAEAAYDKAIASYVGKNRRGHIAALALASEEAIRETCAAGAALAAALKAAKAVP